MANLTLQQLEDVLGTPIVLVTFLNNNTKKLVEVTLESLPAAVQQAVLNFINSHLP